MELDLTALSIGVGDVPVRIRAVNNMVLRATVVLNVFMLTASLPYSRIHRTTIILAKVLPYEGRW